jgi:Ca2+-binding RTX toxin-like protein
VSDVIEVDLGDGDDAIDSTAFPPHPFGTFTVLEIGGPGADQLVDGVGSAHFDPGTGADHVITGGGTGFDYVNASAGSPDEADVFEFGSTPFGTLRYSDATYPVSVSLDDIANDGGAGEGDQVIGNPAVEGGSADDTLIGNDVPNRAQTLTGGAGDDLIVGGAVVDNLRGDSGDDTIRGKGGNDSLYGDFSLKAGDIDGDDTLVGGSGDDFIQGFGGADRLRGGSGTDSLSGDTTVTHDHDRDFVDCGPSVDRLASVSPEDRVRRCEGVRRPR